MMLSGRVRESAREDIARTIAALVVQRRLDDMRRNADPRHARRSRAPQIVQPPRREALAEPRSHRRVEPVLPT
jgi:hypothetical protein